MKINLKEQVSKKDTELKPGDFVVGIPNTVGKCKGLTTDSYLYIAENGIVELNKESKSCSTFREDGIILRQFKSMEELSKFYYLYDWYKAEAELNLKIIK